MESEQICMISKIRLTFYSKYIFAAFVILMLNISTSKSQEKTLIFPLPQEIEKNGEKFILDETVQILIPQHATQSDINLARSL